MSDVTNSKPEIDFIEGPAPTELLITDLVVGDGDQAVPGAQVTVHYVGVDFATGEQFDASWDRGESITFPLAGLIAGWQEGIPGMKVGGRRQLVIPPPPWPTVSPGDIDSPVAPWSSSSTYCPSASSRTTVIGRTIG